MRRRRLWPAGRGRSRAGAGPRRVRRGTGSATPASSAAPAAVRFRAEPAANVPCPDRGQPGHGGLLDRTDGGTGLCRRPGRGQGTRERRRRAGTVNGWICLGFDTPQVLRTGQTSKCTKDNSEILAVLPRPS